MTGQLSATRADYPEPDWSAMCALWTQPDCARPGWVAFSGGLRGPPRGFRRCQQGDVRRMTILIILIVLAMIFFGIGAVIEGLFWMLLIGFALVVAAIWYGWTRLRRTG
jgi:hypothetical protein